MRHRSRLLIPFVAALALWGLYAFLDSNHGTLMWKGKDRAEVLFGPELMYLRFGYWLALIFFIVRLIDAIAFDLVMSRRKHVSAPLLLREIVSIGLFLALIAWAMTTILHVPVTGWLATGTVLAAVLGLALQETLGNLFAGIALHLEDSFDVGDVVRSGDFIGVVEAARWRSSRIRTFNNDIVILPNSLIARERLEIFPRSNLNARILSVGIDYNVPPATVIRVLVEAMTNVTGISHDIEPLARVGGFGESSVTYEMKYFTRDYSLRDRIDAEIRRAVWYALKRNDISIAFPIRSVHRYSAPQRNDHDLAPGEMLERLQAVDVLSPVSGESLEQIAAAARVHFYARGETILRLGSAGNSMFIVHDGTASVRVGGNEIAQLGPGTVFGEMALLQEHPELASLISHQVMERRRSLDTLRNMDADEEQTMLSRIRTWFGLR
jgi:small-conductance mechanosensitive channel